MEVSSFRDQLAKIWRVDAKDLPDNLVEHAKNVTVDKIPDDVAEAMASLDIHLKSDKNLPFVPKVRGRRYFEDDYRPGTRDYPVILVHGTGSDRDVWQSLSENLREDGWEVYALNFGNHGTRLIEDSATEVDAYISGVLAHTKAAKAILVGHSQGGLLLRYWMRHLGGAEKTRHLICLSSPNHGTTFGGIASPLVTTKTAEKTMHTLIDRALGAAAFQQIAGSDFLRKTNEGGDVEPGVSYTCIATRSDAIVQPPESCFLNSNIDGQVRNIWIQDLEPKGQVLHDEMPESEHTIRLVRATLRGIK
ncbi:esterase/lipase family protein [Corynebacterium lubricantis]|uniref:esterase/lipase family protein n=1 Tax=Corynebacterium lubricantis TaxID=541095 RepID=UPI00036F5795|nr:triacylglycerol lipase [Corynebacterium lubricantis]